MASPSTAVRERVKEVIEAEFATEGWTVRSDKLPRSFGRKGEAGVACYPNHEEVQIGRYVELVVPVTLQVYLPFEAKVDEEQAVDPAEIEAVGDRIRSAFQGNVDGAPSNDFWYLNVTRIEYLDDPTGNKTRLEATIVGRAVNESVL